MPNTPVALDPEKVKATTIVKIFIAHLSHISLHASSQAVVVGICTYAARY